LNERLRILKLLEDGKINADEAARLLEALSQSDARDRRKKHKIFNSVEKIPEIVTLVTDHAFKHTFERRHMQFNKKNNVELNGISGTFGIRGSNTDAIDIDKDGFAKVVERNDSLIIKAIHGDLQMNVPLHTNFRVTNVSGDVHISEVDGDLSIASVSGTIHGRKLAGSLEADLISGDIELDYMSVTDLKITSKSGNVTLLLDESAEAAIDINTEDGDMVCEFELVNQEKTDTTLRGILNKPTAKISISNKHGTTTIGKRQPRDERGQTS
jgi:DUF4097 and DUF4098 domain-containing protein YvlB